MIKGINLAFVYVRDIERARKFYEDVVGMPTPKYNTPKWVEYEFEGYGNFALHRSDEMGEADKEVPGHVKCCIQTDTIQEDVARMKDRGVEFVMDLRDEKFYFLAEFKDPDGNFVRLQQYKTH